VRPGPGHSGRRSTYWQLHHCSLGDLSGYNQHDETIANYLISAGGLWLANGVDDFRLDAVKYPFPDFIAFFTREMIEESRCSGGAPLTSSGNGQPVEREVTRNPSLSQTVLTFFTQPFSISNSHFISTSMWAARRKILPNQFSARDLAAYLTERVSAFDGRDDWQGTFIDNHDQMRTVVRLHKLGLSEEDSDRRLDLATVLLMTVRGIPIIMWGDEQYIAHFDDNANPTPGTDQHLG